MKEILFIIFLFVMGALFWGFVMWVEVSKQKIDLEEFNKCVEAHNDLELCKRLIYRIK